MNVGSVGRPRDNNPKAAHVIYDLNEGSIELRQLDYDIRKRSGRSPILACPTAGGQLSFGVIRNVPQFRENPFDQGFLPQHCASLL